MGDALMFKKTIALVTSLCFLLSSIAPIWADQEAKDDPDPEVPLMRTIAETGGQGWAVVDVRRIEGTRVVVSPLVGDELDLEESNRYGLFQGGTVFARRIDLPILRMGVVGFQSAVFMKQANGKSAVKIQFRSGPRIESRLVSLRGENDLRLIREYIENFDDIVKGDYAMGDSSRIEAGADYPLYTDDPIVFEESRPRYPVTMRTQGGLILKDGEQMRGEFVPVYEDGNILIETNLSIRRVAVADIHQVSFAGEAGSAAMGKAIGQGIAGVATGALVGALAAWQANARVKETAIWAAAIFGTFGFITGLVTGAQATQSGEKYVLGPVEGRRKR